jgi:transposase InsO family protein
MRGRYPAGSECVEPLAGSDQAKERLRVILDTLSGHCRVREACARLGVCEQRFRQLRQQALGAALAGLEPRPIGRPPRPVTPEAEHLAALAAELAHKDEELQAAQAREEIALILPRLLHPPPPLWEEQAHLRRLQELAQGSPGAEPARRGFAGQRGRRLVERRLREAVVVLSAYLDARGWAQAATAEALHLAARTLRHWQQTVAAGRPVLGLGRPALRAPHEQRRAVLEALDELGPGVGVAALREGFPDLGCRELADLLARYRRAWRRRQRQLLHLLRWPVAGSVWAIDYAETPVAIDGLYPYLLAVRDLASGQQLLWLPVPEATSAQAQQALATLFALYGAPLVLKSDNGSAFGAAATLALLAGAGVLALFSPPRLPRYNGSIEAGIGSLKTRTACHASRGGHPGQWTWEDVAAAQAEANETSRPRGAAGPSPQQCWQGRPRLGARERESFRAEVSAWREVYRAQEGWPPQAALTAAAERRRDRYAIRRALVGHGYLRYARRRIPLALRGQEAANIP